MEEEQDAGTRTTGDKSKRNTIYQLFILVLTIASLLVVVAVLVLPLSDVSRQYLLGVDTLLCVIFLADFFGSLYNASDRRSYLVKGGWLEFIGSIPAFPVLRFARLARAVRAVRTIRGRRFRDVQREFRGNRARGALLVVALIAILMIGIAGNAVLLFERNAPGANILTGEDAFWWTFVTITTVGYGEYYPVTEGGRIMAMFIMTVGIGFFSVLTGYLATNFLSDRQQEEAEEQEDFDQSGAAVKGEIAALKQDLAAIGRSLDKLERLVGDHEPEKDN
jgi:voltage-gated potassium channel